MDYENEFHGDAGAEEVSSVSSRLQGKQVVNLTADRHRHIIPMSKNQKPKYLYSCGDIGSPIRNATSGLYYGKGHNVGSSMEDFYFRANMSLDGEPRKLFFDSPEQYERFFGNSIRYHTTQWEEVKRQWHLKKIALQT